MAYDSASPLTLKLIRQDLARRLRWLTTGTVDSATTTTFTDADLIDAGETETLFDHAWVKISSDLRRVVAGGYDVDAGTLTVGRAWTSTPSAGDAYEIYKGDLSPTELDECINAALTSLWYRKEEIIPIVADQTDYDLSSYLWIVHPDQIYDVVVRVGDTANEYNYVDLPWWEIKRTDAAEATTSAMPYTNMYLYVKPLGDTSSSIVLRGMAQYAQLASDNYATSAPYDWLMAAAEWQVYDRLSRDMPSADRTVEVKLREQAGIKMLQLSRRYMPRPVVKVQHPHYTYSSYNPLELQEEA